MALLVLGLCCGAYVLNGDPLPGGDDGRGVLAIGQALERENISVD